MDNKIKISKHLLSIYKMITSCFPYTGYGNDS